MIPTSRRARARRTVSRPSAPGSATSWGARGSAPASGNCRRGETAYPFHFHYSDEELVFVLRGRPTLRTPEGTRELEPGEAVHFPLGERGAHQVSNRTDEEVRFLAVSTNGAADVVVYPDSNKICAAERLPEGGGLHTFFDLDSQVEYWKGESAPE
jgi:uncharacterized cupin superfamily protein